VIVTVVPEADDADSTVRAAQPRQLIVTVYGLYSRDDGGWLSVARLIELLVDLAAQAARHPDRAASRRRGGL
jgi:phenylacetic acid degradation operon negative regulatory protein